MYHGTKFRMQRPELRLEIMADDWAAERAVETIVRAGSADDSGQIGDCKVLVRQLDGDVPSVIAHKDRWPWQSEGGDPWRL